MQNFRQQASLRLDKHQKCVHFCPNYSFFFSGRILVHAKIQKPHLIISSCVSLIKDILELEMTFDTMQCGTNYFYVSLHASGWPLHSCHSIKKKKKKAEKFASNSSHSKPSKAVIWLQTDSCSVASLVTTLLPKPSPRPHPPSQSQLQGPSHSCIQIFITSCTGSSTLSLTGVNTEY